MSIFATRYIITIGISFLAACGLVLLINPAPVIGAAIGGGAIFLGVVAGTVWTNFAERGDWE